MQLAVAAVVPHAPLLLEEVAGRDTAPSVVDATRGLQLAPGVVVIASPHGSRTGVYAGASGDLGGFGRAGVGASATPSPEMSAELARLWGRPVLDGAADHGIVVPLRLLPVEGIPVVAVTFAEALSPDDAIAEGAGLARALGGIDATVAFVASANTSAGLGERAPLPSLPGASETETALIRALDGDAASIAALLPALAAAGSCAAGPLAAFAALAGGRETRLLAYEHPFGVGYPVAVAR